MASDKARTKAKQLMALALGSPYSEEARTSAVAALQLIEQHDMLGLGQTPKGDGKAVAKASDDATVAVHLREIDRLKRQIERLKREKRDVRPPPTSKVATLDVVSHMREIEALKREIVRLQTMPPKAFAVAVPIPIHVVQPDESPMTIALLYTGNPLRYTELVGANLHRPTYIEPRSGWRTFTSLSAGERLMLPVGWA